MHARQIHLFSRGSTSSSRSGYVSFAEPEVARQALEDANGSIFQGRILQVSVANERRMTASLRAAAGPQDDSSVRPVNLLYATVRAFI